MSWHQTLFSLPPKSRGSYLITAEVEKAVPEIKNYKIGLLNLFMQHTSAALSLNENWDEEVREDMSDALDRIAPEDKKGNLYRHAAVSYKIQLSLLRCVSSWLVGGIILLERGLTW